MSRLFTLIAAASLLSLAACQSAKEKAPQAAQPAAETVAAAPAAPAEAAPMAEPAPAPAAPIAQPAAPEPAAAPVVSAAAPAVAPAKPAPAVAKPAAPAPSAAKPAAISQEEALALAGKGNCLACHKIESKVVGPAWKAVAAKYKGDPNAAATIADHIKKGGSFGWKFGTMPARGGSKISDADVAKLAGFIAGLK